jgi:hypothetical protein
MSSDTIVAGMPSRARIIAGIAVNGWAFKPSPVSTSRTPTATTSSDIWARKHLGMTTAAFSGITAGTLAGALLLVLTICLVINRKGSRRKAKADEEHTYGAEHGIRNMSASDAQMELNSVSDVALSDLDSSGTRIPSATDTVVHHIEHSKSEGSSMGEDRTA